MVDARPLRLRLVQPSWAERVCSPAHDALTPSDRRAHLAVNPDSYLAVTRGLEDVDPGESVTAADLLTQGRDALDRLRQNGAFCPERGDEYFVYRLDEGNCSVTGIVGGVAVDDYRTGQVRIHEHVKANRAIHLANHLDVVGVQSSPIATAHRPDPAIAAAVDDVTATEPLLDFTLEDGLRQRVWSVPDEAGAVVRERLAAQPLYLIDGHHRAAAAATYRAAAGPGGADWVLTAIFPTDDLHNAPHHRLLRPERGIPEMLRAIGRRHRLRSCDRDEIDRRADDEVALFADGAWYCLALPRSGGTAPADRVADLDPQRFHDQVVNPLLHLDPEADDRSIDYLAGRRDLADLEAAVGDGEVLALMRTVPVEVLVDAADAGLVMPPKSTYFEPKVRSGVFLRGTS